MFSSLRKSWAALRRSRPGHRFQASYERGHKSANRQPAWRRAGLRLAGFALVVGGGVLLIIPGPGLPLVVAGAALLARDSRSVARALDWIELKVRALLRPLRRLGHKVSEG